MLENGNPRDWRHIARQLAAETNRDKIRQLSQELDAALERELSSAHASSNTANPAS